MSGSAGTSPDGRRARVLERLAAGPSRIAAAARRAAALELDPLLDPRLDPLADAGWTAREVAGHLWLVERVVFQARLDELAAGGSPHWAWTEPGTPAARDNPTLDDALDRFAAGRAATLARVGALDEAGWRRSGTHATFGRLDVVGLLEVVADHDAEHHDELAARVR